MTKTNVDGWDLNRLVQAQCDMILRETRRIDEQGYAILVHGSNPNGDNPTRPYGYMTGGFTQLLKSVLGVYCVKANVYVKKDNEVSFKVTVPNRVRYRAVTAAFGLMSRNWNQTNKQFEGSGVFECMPGSERNDYRGKNRAQLYLALKILDLPAHRQAMIGNTL